MRSLPPEPNPGDKVSASLIRELIRAIRSLMPIQGPGMKISTGPNGTTYSAKSVSVAKPSSGEGNPLFAIRTVKEDEGEEGEGEEYVKKVVNCYYMIGGIMSHHADIEWNEAWKDGYLCVFYDMSPKEINLCVISEADLMTSQKASTSYIQPLYLLDDEGEVILDLRNIINFQMFESLSYDDV